MPISAPKMVTVKYPWCTGRFTVQIEAKYKGAKVIPDPLPTCEGFYKQCPNDNCGRVVFIHCQ